jgi:hypothetical protein
LSLACIQKSFSIFEGAENTFLQDFDEAHLVGAVSGIIVVNIASRAELNALEYALYFNTKPNEMLVD